MGRVTGKSRERNDGPGRKLFGAILLVLILILSSAAHPFSPREGSAAQDGLRREVVDHALIVNNDTWKNDTELVLRANITVQNNASFYLSSSLMRVEPDNDTILWIQVKDNATLFLEGSTVLGMPQSGGRTVGGDGAVDLLVVCDRGTLLFHNSSLRNTVVEAKNSSARFFGCEVQHQDFNFSSWQNSSLELVQSSIISSEGPLGLVEIQGQPGYSLGAQPGIANITSFLLERSSSLLALSSNFTLCQGDATGSLSLEQLQDLRFLDGVDPGTAAFGSGILRISLDGVLVQNLSIGEDGGSTRIPIFSFQEGEVTRTKEIAYQASLMEAGKLVGYQEMNITAEDLLNQSSMEFLFYPEISLGQPHFYHRDREVSSIVSGDTLDIRIEVSNTGTRTVLFDLYFYVLFNIEKVFDRQQNVALGFGESEMFTGTWDSSEGDYPARTWSLLVTIDNATPPEMNIGNSEVSKSIRLEEEETKGRLLVDIAVTIFPYIILLLIASFLYVRRVEIFGDYTVDDALLLDPGGRLIGHFARIEHTVDRHVVGSMLHAIQDFVNVSFREEDSDRLKSLKHGDKMILVEYGELASLAVVIQGTPSAELRHEMLKTVFQIHNLYGESITSWDGDVTSFPEVTIMLENLAGKRFGLGYELKKFVDFVRSEVFRTGGGNKGQP